MQSMISMIICVIFLFKIATISCGLRSAIYIDNGKGQTAIDRDMSTSEKREIELEFLNLLGLPNRPRKINKATFKKSAPKFLLDVYKSLLEEQEDGQSNNRKRRNVESTFTGDEQEKIDQSDVIMTIESINHHIPSVRHERGKRLWFNVSGLPVVEDIVGGELRIYQNQSLAKHKNKHYIVTAYQLVDNNSGENELEYISEVETFTGFTGWIEINVTSCLSSWVVFPKSNRGIYLSVRPKNKTHDVRPEDIGLITVKGDDETHPFMVVFLKATPTAKVRTTRELQSRVKKSEAVPFYSKIGEPEPRSTCRINTLYISFRDLKWQDWIIAPDGYASYFCYGECNFPLNAHMNASNHAIVQTLVHLMNPTRYPKSCCAPTKLSPISVLYFLDESNVVLKKYRQMVVKTCGCR